MSAIFRISVVTQAKSSGKRSMPATGPGFKVELFEVEVFKVEVEVEVVLGVVFEVELLLLLLVLEEEEVDEDEVVDEEVAGKEWRQLPTSPLAASKPIDKRIKSG